MKKIKGKNLSNIPAETRRKIDKLKKAIEAIGFSTEETRDGEIKIERNKAKK